jgi:hypothetical protein
VLLRENARVFTLIIGQKLPAQFHSKLYWEKWKLLFRPKLCEKLL